MTAALAMPTAALAHTPAKAPEQDNSSCFTLTDTFKNQARDAGWAKTLHDFKRYGGIEGAALVQSMKDGNVQFCTETDMPISTEAYYQLETHSVHTLHESKKTASEGTKLHETVHALQTNLGFGIAPDISIEGYVTSKLMAEAGANAATLVIAHQMKENGKPEAWDSFHYDSIQKAFSESFEQDKDYKKAAKAAWDKFFDRKGLVSSYAQAAVIEAIHKLDEGILSRQSNTHPVTSKELKAFATLPSGVQFVERTDMPKLADVLLQGRKGKEAYLLVQLLESVRRGQTLPAMAQKIDTFIKTNHMNRKRTEQTIDDWREYISEKTTIWNLGGPRRFNIATQNRDLY